MLLMLLTLYYFDYWCDDSKHYHINFIWLFWILIWWFKTLLYDNSNDDNDDVYDDDRILQHKCRVILLLRNIMILNIIYWMKMIFIEMMIITINNNNNCHNSTCIYCSFILWFPWFRFFVWLVCCRRHAPFYFYIPGILYSSIEKSNWKGITSQKPSTSKQELMTNLLALYCYSTSSTIVVFEWYEKYHVK